MEQLSPLALAFLGDAVHTLFVRESVLSCDKKMQTYHREASKFCKAEAQAAALKRILPLLSQEELDIARRARNAHPKHTAKHATSADYASATAFEAVIGYLHTKKLYERERQLLALSIEEEHAD